VFLPLEKASVTADCLENHFSPHDLCEESHEWRVMARVQALPEAVEDSLPERVRPCDVQKLINSLQTQKGLWN
jgi:hypothetical protein